MQFKEPKVEFVQVRTDDVISTSAGYINCENTGQYSMGSLKMFCLSMGTGMSQESYECLMAETAMGDYTPPTGEP